MLTKSKMRELMTSLISTGKFDSKNEGDFDFTKDQYQNPQVIFHCKDGDYFLTNDQNSKVIYLGRTEIGDVLILKNRKYELKIVPAESKDGTEKIHRNFKDLCQKIVLDLNYSSK